MITTVNVECSGRDNPARNKRAHSTVLVAVMMVDGVGQWSPAYTDRTSVQPRRGRCQVYYRPGDERVSMRLPDGAEVRCGEETVTVECTVPGCGRRVTTRASRWTVWLDDCAARGVSLSISGGKFI